MAKCRFAINVNGHYQEFETEQELNNFLRENKRGLSASLLSEKVLFSKDRTIQQKIYSELGAVSSEVAFDEEEHKYTVNNIEYTPVTKVISQGKERVGMNFVTGFDMAKWEENTMNRLLSERNPEGEAKHTKESAQTIINSLKHKWQVQSLLGTSWHKIAQDFFDDKITNEQDIINAYPELNDVSNYVLQKYIRSLTKFKDNLLARHPNSLFLTEVKLFDDESKIAGTSDLLVIDENGDVHIYDYKTSTKDELDWDSNKNETNRYQLAFYRQMLRRKGYNVKSTHIVPVMIKDVDYETGKIFDFEMGRISTKQFNEIEPLMQNVKQVMPYNFSQKVLEITNNTPIHTFMKEAFNYEQKKVVKDTQNIDTEYKRMIDNQKNPDSNYYYYRPFNANNYTYSFSKSLSEQEIKDKISVILKDVDEANSKLPQKVAAFVRDAKNIISEGGSLGDVPWVKWSKDDSSNIKIRNLVYKYVMDPSWQVVETDTLADINIVCFENTKTNELDFVSLSSSDLTKSPELLKGKTLLGNFLTDRKANELNITSDVTNGDVELLKVYAFIKNNRDIFLDKKIGSIFALNLLEGNKIPKIKTQTLSTLEKWYKALSLQLAPEFNIQNSQWEPQEIDKTKAFITYITDLFGETKWKSKTTGLNKIEPLLNRLNGVDFTERQEKIELLNSISNLLIKSIGDDFSTIQQSSDNNDTGLLIKLANDAILQLSKVPTMIEEDLKQWSHLMVLGENTNTTSANMFKNLAMKELNKAVVEAFNNTRHKFLDFLNEKGGIRDMHDKIYKANGNLIKIKTLGYNLDVFEGMLEKNDGKHTMRFKELSKLTPTQREYAESFLKMVNTVRIEKMRTQGKPEEDIAAFIQSPDYRNIPLLKASALTAFKGKDFKNFINEFFRDIINPNNILKEDAESIAKMEAQREMINSFDIYDLNLQGRVERLDTATQGEFEIDLELVLSMYMMAHAKEVEVSKKLPVINAIKTTVMMNEIYGFTPSPNLKSLQTDYLGTTIYGKAILGGESEETAKLIKVVQDVTSTAVMGFSPFSGLTELFTGFFNNVTRLAANKYTEHTFGFSDYTKAHALIGGTMLDKKMTYDQINFVDSLNEIYGISDMDIKQLPHEAQSTAAGLKNFKSKYAFWFNTFPSYFNRMVIFIAQAHKDGVLDIDSSGHISKKSAYQVINGKMTYNEKLDKRFSVYTNNKDAKGAAQTTEWKTQKALYEAISQDLSTEPNGLKADGTLNRAYSNRQRGSLKEFADEVHGSYDTETKTNFQKTAFGRIFLQFKGWVITKKNRYYTTTFDNENRGRFVMEDDGTGNIVAVWKGKVTEGIWQSICAMKDEIMTNQGNIIKSWDNLNPTQKENFMFLIADTLILAILTLLISLIDLDDLKENSPIAAQAVRSLNNSTKDLFIGNSIGAITGERNPLSLASWTTGVLDDTWGALTGRTGATDILQNVAIYRTVNNITNIGQ